MSLLKQKTDKAELSPQALAFDWQAALVTLLVSAAAFSLVAGQFSSAPDPQSQQISLSSLDQRVPVLEQITNWVQRDQFCVPLAAYGRALDAALAPDARVFMTGMLGPTNQGSLGYYYFLRNYLFPRHVETSLDGHARNTMEGLAGVPCDSPDVLRSNGYDLMIQFSNNQLHLIPLTPKAFPHSE